MDYGSLQINIESNIINNLKSNQNEKNVQKGFVRFAAVGGFSDEHGT